jgi:hypothetical protein
MYVSMHDFVCVCVRARCDSVALYQFIKANIQVYMYVFAPYAVHGPICALYLSSITHTHDTNACMHVKSAHFHKHEHQHSTFVVNCEM